MLLTCMHFYTIHTILPFHKFRPEGQTSFIAPEYGCITPLRMLQLNRTDPSTWDRLELLMDHDEDRKKEAEYQNMFQVRQYHLRVKVMFNIILTLVW